MASSCDCGFVALAQGDVALPRQVGAVALVVAVGLGELLVEFVDVVLEPGAGALRFGQVVLGARALVGMSRCRPCAQSARRCEFGGGVGQRLIALSQVLAQAAAPRPARPAPASSAGDAAREVQRRQRVRQHLAPAGRHGVQRGGTGRRGGGDGGDLVAMRRQVRERAVHGLGLRGHGPAAAARQQPLGRCTGRCAQHRNAAAPAFPTACS